MSLKHIHIKKKCKTLSFLPSESPSLELPTLRAGELGLLPFSPGGQAQGFLKLELLPGGAGFSENL